MAKKMHLEDLLYTQGFGTRRVCAGLLEKGLVQVYVDENTSENDEKSSVAGVFTASKATECIAKGLRFKVQGEDWEYHEHRLCAVQQTHWQRVLAKAVHAPQYLHVFTVATAAASAKKCDSRYPSSGAAWTKTLPACC